jgi:hypothetical protein
MVSDSIVVRLHKYGAINPLDQVVSFARPLYIKAFNSWLPLCIISSQLYKKMFYASLPCKEDC